MTTIREALTDASQQLKSSDTPRLDAQVLLEHVLQVNRAYLFAHDDDRLSLDHHAQFQDLIQRRAKGEPIAYIIGTRGFYDLEFDVTPDVLIPRPETELLLEEALRLMKDKPDATVLDVGTGSGALAVTYAVHMPHSEVYAIDISPSALQMAESNAKKNGAQVQFLQGSLAQPLIEHEVKVDLLMANLPYIRSDEMSSLAVSQHEPHLALDGGEDGLDLIRQLIQQIPSVCLHGANILLEIGAEQGHALQKLIYKSLNVECDILQDYAGLDRIGRFRYLA